jgi:AcrR family transcriptional regulator
MPRARHLSRKPRATPRERILAAATELITGGSDAVTTRAVAEIAEVQAPTIYRLFEDKEGLLNAVAERVFATYAAEKARSVPCQDAVDDLRVGWDAHVAFGVTYPAVFSLLYATIPCRSPAVEAGLAVLRAKVHRVAISGRLRASEERAVDLLHAAGIGTVFALFAKPPETRAGMANAARDAVFGAILDAAAPPANAGIVRLASTLRAAINEISNVTPGERQLLGELLERIATPR